MPTPGRVSLQGSQPAIPAHAAMIGSASPHEQITATITLKHKADIPHEVPHVTAEQFQQDFGADPAVVAKVITFAHANGLVVLEADSAKRRVIVHGDVNAINKAFDVTLKQFGHPGGTFRSHEGEVKLPADIAQSIEAVLGLSNRPVAKPHFQIARKPDSSRFIEAMAFGGEAKDRPVPMLTTAVAHSYHFPSKYDGSGHCVGIIELGGGYTPKDMETYFQKVGQVVPAIVDVSVGGGRNTPGSDADGEVELDIQVVGTVVPKAKIAVYFADNSSQGFVNAIVDAAHDKTNRPDVISISWGGPENTWSYADMAAMHNAIKDAATLGVTVVVASGDAGSNDGVGDGLAHCDFPASSPYAVACGGTQLIVNSTGEVASEIVWNEGTDSAGGGGISHHYPVPSYQQPYNIQKSANHPTYAGRGVPDLAGNADPYSGYEIVVDGQAEAVGGTSAVAPLYAGLFIQIAQAKGKRLGFVHPTLYGKGASAFRQVTAAGNNGAYAAKPGDRWNACVGLGIAVGTKLLAAFS